MKIGKLRSRRYVLLFAGILVPLAAGCGNRAALDPILIGHVAPLSGLDKDAGEQARKGILLAVEEANSEGQVVGRKVVVDHADTRTDPSAVRGVTMRLLTVSRVVALLGGNELAAMEGLDTLAQTHTVPVIVSGSTARATGSYLFYTGLPPAQQGQVLARFTSSELKTIPVAVLYHADHLSIADAFIKEYPGNKVVGRWEYSSPEKLKAAVEEVKKKTPAAVLFAGPAADLMTVDGTGFGKIPILVAGVEASLAKLRWGGPVYAVTAFADDESLTALKEFSGKYQTRFGEPPSAPAALAFDNARLLFGAMRTANSLDGLKVRDALAEGRHDGVTGPLFFTPERMAVRAAFVVAWKDGRSRLVKRYDAEEKQASRTPAALAGAAAAR